MNPKKAAVQCYMKSTIMLPSPIGAGLVVFDWGFQPVAAAIPVAYALVALT
jgi:hypothetical protein